MSALPELEIRRVAKFCETFVPEHVRDKIRLEHVVEANRITIVERRPPWDDPKAPEWTRHKVVQFRLDRQSGLWSMYWWRHTGRWYLYEEIAPARTLAPLIKEVDEDPIHIFWG